MRALWCANTFDQIVVNVLRFSAPLETLTRRIYIEYNIQKSKEGDKLDRD